MRVLVTGQRVTLSFVTLIDTQGTIRSGTFGTLGLTSGDNSAVIRAYTGYRSVRVCSTFGCGTLCINRTDFCAFKAVKSGTVATRSGSAVSRTATSVGFYTDYRVFLTLRKCLQTSGTNTGFNTLTVIGVVTATAGTNSL